MIENEIASIAMKEEYVAPRGGMCKMLGTHGLGPCIGVAVIGKHKIGVAHTTDFTQLESLENFAKQFQNEQSQDLNVFLVTTKGTKERASEILNVLKKETVFSKANINPSLTIAHSFAINTDTGELFTNVPENKFKLAEDIPVTDIFALSMWQKDLITPGPIKKSKFYQIFAENRQLHQNNDMQEKISSFTDFSAKEKINELKERKIQLSFAKSNDMSNNGQERFQTPQAPRKINKVNIDINTLKYLTNKQND